MTLLTFVTGRLVLLRSSVEIAEIRTLADLARAGVEHDFFCSSSIDFPEEETTDANLIAICRRVRGR
jgi:hypothetical protein